MLCLLALSIGSVALAPAAVTAGHHQKQRRHLPAKFFGISPNRGIPSPASFARMRNGGITTYKAPLYWSTVQPSKGVFNWGISDFQVALAVQGGMDVFPFVVSTPAWLGVGSRVMPVASATQRAAWAAFLRAAVARYGPHGNFWKKFPALNYKPIRAWQIWNEENATYYTNPVSVSGYAQLLKISSRAIKRVDRGATVVTGGLYGRPKLPNTLSASNFLKRLYHVKGVNSSFDAVGLHPYAHDLADMRTQIVGIRSIMKKAGDTGASIWLDEFGWGSGLGKTSYEKGPEGQKKMLVGAYKMLIANQRRWKVARTYWFSWDDVPPGPGCFYCHTSGLFTSTGTPKPAWYGFVGVTRGKP
jgi:hypothetical protein